MRPPKIHDVEQGTPEWLKVRMGMVTASDLDRLLTPAFEIRKGKMPKSLMHSKMAEGLRGLPNPGFSSFATEEGQELEIEARSRFALDEDHKMKNVGFVENEEARFGCSPDALLDDDGGLEIKCPFPQTHVKYLDEEILPEDYACQVHGSMFATGRTWWKFYSYHRRMQPFILTVQRDEAICAKIQEALTGFYAKYDEAMAKLRRTA